MMSRMRFDFATAGTPMSDTGPAMFGRVHMARWYRSSGDTGGTIEATLMLDAGDTGPGVVVFSAGLTPGGWLKFPRWPSHDPSGDVDGDTGAPVAPQPLMAFGERLRLKLTPGGTGVTGRVWVWTR